MTVSASRDVRLRKVVTADFRKNEATNWQLLEDEGEIPRGLKADDVICMLSHTQTQIVFVRPPYEHAINGKVIKVTASQRLRIAGGSWNPLLLANYAEDVGLRLVGLPKFEEHYRAVREEARQAAREAARVEREGRDGNGSSE